MTGGAATSAQADGGAVPRCRAAGCRAVIWFGLTDKNRRMPLDPAPVADGNVILCQDGIALQQLAVLAPPAPGAGDIGLPRVRVLKKGEVVGPDVPRYVSHFASCPAQARFRRGPR